MTARRTLVVMRLLRRRRSDTTSKASALAAARKATRDLRRTDAKVRRHQAGKQENPTERMTPNQWIAGGS